MTDRLRPSNPRRAVVIGRCREKLKSRADLPNAAPPVPDRCHEVLACRAFQKHCKSRSSARRGRSCPGPIRLHGRIVQAAPSEHNALNALGVLALQAGQWNVAEGYIQRAIASHAADPAYHNNLNLIYRGMGRHEEAVACCRQDARIGSSLPELHNNLGIELKEVGALEEATESLQRGATAPDYADAHYNLGNTLADLHRLEAAEAAYRRASTWRDSEPHNNLGRFCNCKGDLPKPWTASRRLSMQREFRRGASQSGVAPPAAGRLFAGLERLRMAVANAGRHLPELFAAPLAGPKARRSHDSAVDRARHWRRCPIHSLRAAGQTVRRPRAGGLFAGAAKPAAIGTGH